MHWADVLAEELLERGSEHTLATGITPSGPIHVGNLREVLTTEAVHRAVQDQGGSSTLLYVGDTYDPLRKVYPFLEDHPEIDYADHVGEPISTVPAPDGEHESFAHRFLSPFLDALAELGIDPEIRLAHELYESGAYREAIEQAIDHGETIRGILNDVAGRDLEPGWVPFNPRCPDCGRFSEAEITASDGTSLEIRCSCGFTGSLDALDPGAGKLPWRVDWPARWAFLGVSFEAFGKDHAASGGSWDTAVPIAEQVYGIDPPGHEVYEWIHVEGEGAMSSSRGTGIAAQDVLEVTPPEVLRFLFMRYRPNKHVEFDAGEGLLDLVDGYDRAMTELEEEGTSDELRDPERVLELSQPSGEMPEHPSQHVSMRHLARLVDIYEDTEEVLASVRRSGHIEEVTDAEEGLLRSRIERTRAWLATFAPEDAQFRLAGSPPPVELVHAMDEYRKPAIGLLDQEPGRLRTRVHELTAWLDGAPNVASQGPGPPEELAVFALWRALAARDAVDVEPPTKPRDLAGELQTLFEGEIDRVDRQSSDQVLVPLALHLVRSMRRPAVDRDPQRLADRVEAKIDAIGAGRPGSLPDPETLAECVRVLHTALHEGLPDARDRSPGELRRLTDALEDALAEAGTEDLSEADLGLPELAMTDVLVARSLLERARSGLATFRERARDSEWTADELQSCVYDTAEKTSLPTGDAFGLVYLAVLDRERGPRLGPFLVGLERDWVLDRLAALTGP
jgi:lysyl-tRNA synthetase class 1